MKAVYPSDRKTILERPNRNILGKAVAPRRPHSTLTLLVLFALLSVAPRAGVDWSGRPASTDFKNLSIDTDQLRETALLGYAVQDLPLRLQRVITSYWNDCLNRSPRAQTFGGKPSEGVMSALDHSASMCASKAVRSGMIAIIPDLLALDTIAAGGSLASEDMALRASRMPRLPAAPVVEAKGDLARAEDEPSLDALTAAWQQPKPLLPQNDDPSATVPPTLVVDVPATTAPLPSSKDPS